MDKVQQEKINMWQGKLQELEKQLAAMADKRTEATEMGEGEDSVLFQTLDEEANTYRVRIDEIKTIITKLEEEK